MCPCHLTADANQISRIANVIILFICFPIPQLQLHVLVFKADTWLGLTKPNQRQT